MRIMCISGYAPNLGSCAVCGKQEPAEPRFSPRNGIMVCRECRRTEHQANVRLCPDSLKTLRYICEAEPRRILSFRTTDKAMDNAACAAETYLLTQTERTFSALSYWKQIKL